MHQQNAPAVVANDTVNAKPRRSERQRKATARFAEGWCASNLPSLSLALGIGAVAQDPRDDHAATTTATATTTTAGELPLSDKVACLATLGCEACDEAPALGSLDEEIQGDAQIDEVEAPRRSGRKRHPTKRFEEGRFGEWLPRLCTSLGMAVADEKVR